MQTAILFDIDGTLLDADGAGGRAMEIVLREDWQLSAASADVPMHGRTDTAIVADVLDVSGVTADRTADFRAGYVRRLAETLPAGESRLLPGAAEAVRRTVETPDVLAGVLTGNLQAAAEVKLSYHSLADAFDFGAYGDDHTSRDDLARDAAARLRRDHAIPPHRVWIVGDTTADICCARAAGFRVAAVATGGSTRIQLAESRPDRLLDSLLEFEGVLELVREELSH